MSRFSIIPPTTRFFSFEILTEETRRERLMLRIFGKVTFLFSNMQKKFTETKKLTL